MHPKYSIIIPVYNVAQWLPACLDSVLRQTIDDWECICVDDGSTDGSGTILDSYLAKDRRFRVYRKLNGGAASARNQALDVVSGEWLVFLDADDMLADGALQIFNRLEVAAPNADLMNYGLAVVAESDFAGRREKAGGQCSFFKTQDRAKIVPGFYGIDFWTYAYRRSVMGDLRFKGYSIGEDRLYLAECHARCREKAWCNEIGYLVRSRKNSAIRSTWSLRKFRDSIGSRRDAIAVVDALDVQLGARDRRMIYQALLEVSPFDICRVERRDVTSAWRAYFEAIRTLDRGRVPTCWQRFVLGVLRLTRSRTCGEILCVVPHRLKLLKTRLKRRLARRRHG